MMMRSQPAAADLGQAGRVAHGLVAQSSRGAPLRSLHR